MATHSPSGGQASVEERIKVEVAYALPHKQTIIALDVPLGTTALQAVALSGIDREFPGLDLTAAPLGIFGQAIPDRGVDTPATRVLSAGDRVEIYRPLICDPKDARRRRAEKNKETKP